MVEFEAKTCSSDVLSEVVSISVDASRNAGRMPALRRAGWSLAMRMPRTPPARTTMERVESAELGNPITQTDLARRLRCDTHAAFVGRSALNLYSQGIVFGA